MVLGLTEGMFFISFLLFFVHWTTGHLICVHMIVWVMVPMMTMTMNDGWEMSCGLATI